jgi:poly(3-hydroxybutyrate) depolymerase
MKNSSISNTILKATALVITACLYWGDASALGGACTIINIQQQYQRPDGTPANCRTATIVPPARNRIYLIDRSYILCVPQALEETPEAQRPAAPLVLAFHGAGENSDGESFKNRTQFEVKGFEEGFITAYPNGCRLGDIGDDKNGLICNGGNWNAQGSEPRGISERCNVDDAQFVDLIISDVKDQQGYPLSKTLAFGHSKGGMFAYSLACDRPSTLSAIGVTASTQTDVSCATTSTTGYPAVFHVHNLQDVSVPFFGGGVESDWPPVEPGLQLWAARSGCDLAAADDHDFGQNICFEASCQSASFEVCLLGADMSDASGDDPTDPSGAHNYLTYDSAFAAKQGESIRDAFVRKLVK